MNILKAFLVATLSLFLLGCDEEPETPATPRYYFSGTIGTEDLRVEHDASHVFSGNELSENGDTYCSKGYEIALSSLTGQSTKGISVSFRKLLEYDQSCDGDVIAQDFVSAFEAGDYNYGTETKEIVIIYRDESGVLWGSDTVDQDANSNFNVQGSAETTSNRYFSNQMVEVKCTFNCTVYNYETNESLEITNAEAFYLFFNG